ncbi:hypothetical protein SELMODRAFT_438464 [Selaginella moellendorffii]|uniref:Acyl-coenzyme A oxidase n=1 Tax=Selaginella moellendorffii TaxID=88036 RepID=D8QYA4_SELML|nr:peroxisomal acyl-coenzyme A oxidase 1 [Selaginella moellendorffii]EFJ35164.1 hypothetical protein SELMODRAFT_438464 [Selaginella moellendorffii]|eukprot:XP_002963293.1 peroxisomal acyl-coenzyme A oxidase 1 [Selaginella moellendorffii]
MEEAGRIDHLSGERQKAQFDLQPMKVLLAGGEHELDVAQRVAAIVARDPVFSKANRTRLSREELYKNSLRKASHGWKLIQQLKLTEEEAFKLRSLVDEPTFTDLHWGMFVPAIKGQATDEQQKYWLPLAYKMAVIGCYAQTELGHGSNVQGLETTATFDPATDEFVMNSPNLTSTKWWPGGLGKASTHALVYARLITDNHDYGIHAFIVQIRSLDDHKPLPGVTVADIGVKFGNAGYNTMDNGLLRFDQVRIPRNNMLMKLAKVTKEGKYISSDVPKQLAYGAMVYVRQSIVSDASVYLSRAVTIAVRYSCVRRQFGGQGNDPETQVIDYKTQQHRLFPLLATTYAYRIVGQWLKWLYSDVMNRLESHDFSTLPEVHACTSGLKSLTTSVAADGIEECRKLCGGHGYLCSSGLPELYAAYVPACTYEGDNVVLLLQVARFLLKTLSQLGGGVKPVGTASYLGNLPVLTKQGSRVSQGTDWLDHSNLLYAFEARAARLALVATQLVQKAGNEAGFEQHSIELIEAARAHCELMVLSKFVERLQRGVPGRGVQRQLDILCEVYGLFLLVSRAGDFLSTGCLTPTQVALAKQQLQNLYTEVRPNAVALVDAFGHTDHYLGSILGRYDGDVYPNLYKDAWEEPLNKTVVTDGYEEYIRPILQQEFLTSRKARL